MRLTRPEFEREYLNEIHVPNFPLPLLIVSRSYAQAKHLADKNGIPRKQWRFCANKNEVYGMTGSVCFYGDWYERKDFHEIREAVQMSIASGCLTFLTANQYEVLQLREDSE